MATTETSAAAKVDTDTFAREIDLFVKHIDAIGAALTALALAMHEVVKKYRDELHKFEDEYCEIVEGEPRSARVPNAHFRAWRVKRQSFERFATAGSLLQRSLLVSMISQYDAYLGRLLRAIFIRKPDILNASERKISFEALNQFPTIEAAREFVLEKEVESILRSSHVDQFRWMEKTFNLPLTKGLTN